MAASEGLSAIATKKYGRRAPKPALQADAGARKPVRKMPKALRKMKGGY